MYHVTKKSKYRYPMAAPAALLTAVMLTACGSHAGATDMQNAESSSSYDLTEALNLNATGSSAVTAADKEKKYLAYLQSYLEEELLEPLDDIKNATVTLSVGTEADNSLMNTNSEVHVNVMLELENELTAYSADELAEILANGVGNESTDNIVIMDSDGNQLFPEGI